jgi:hypothetical protein
VRGELGRRRRGCGCIWKSGDEDGLKEGKAREGSARKGMGMRISEVVGFFCEEGVEERIGRC